MKLRVPQREDPDLEHIKAACPFCFPDLFVAKLSCESSTGVFDWPTHPNDRHLWPIYSMLASGVNVTLALTKEDGSTFTYRIVERLGEGADAALSDAIASHESGTLVPDSDVPRPE